MNSKMQLQTLNYVQYFLMFTAIRKVLYNNFMYIMSAVAFAM